MSTLLIFSIEELLLRKRVSGRVGARGGGNGRGEGCCGFIIFFYFLFLKRNPCFLKVDVEILL